MSGYVAEKNGFWYMVFSYKDTNGVWKQKWEKTGLPVKGNKRRAQEMLDERKKQFGSSDQVLANSNRLFLDSMEEWLNNVKSMQVRSNTLEQYINAFNYNIKSYMPFQRLPLQKLNAKTLQEFYSSKYSGGMSANTVHKLHANINGFLKYAVAMDMISSNPAERVSLPKKEKSNVGVAYSVEQAKKLIEVIENDPLNLVVFLALNYGLRRSEICGLMWSDIDFVCKRIYIRHTAIVVGGKVEYKERTKTAKSRRVLPMSDIVIERLQQVKAEQEQQRIEFGSSWPNSDCVCLRSDGVPLDPTFVSHHFKRVLKKHNLPDIRFHDLRHTVASLLHDEGWTFRDIQGFLGHSDFATTANIYTHLDQSRFDGMAQATERIYQ